MKPGKAVGIQYAALPYRIRARTVEILLITSRDSGRWVIPKGWPMNGLKPQEAAATEASEEAGVVGAIEDRPAGSYHYDKQFKADRTAAVQVIVFPFLVQYQADDWKEQGQRRFAWFPYRKAAALVREPGLSHLMRDFGDARTPTLLAQGLWRYRAWRLAAR